MRISTVLVVGAAGIVAAAAIVSSVRGSGDDSSVAPSPGAAATTAPTTTRAAIPIGDVRRLPALAAGTYTGQIFGFTSNLCVVVAVDLTTLAVTGPGGVPDACSIWVSPGNRALASRRPPPNDGKPVLTTTEFTARPEETGLSYVPGRSPGALTVADDGAIAVCDGTSVRIARNGRVQTVRRFTPVDGVFEERCVTGAVGRRIVRLGDDRRSLVDVATHRVVRRLATAVPTPVAAITSSSDGLVLIADLADGPPQGTVYDESGRVVAARTPIGHGVSIRKLVLARDAGAVAVQSARGWEITNLLSKKTLVAPGGERVNDVAFSPDGDAVALATDNGVVFASVSSLTPTALLAEAYQAVAWPL